MIEYSARGRLCVLSIAHIMLCPMVWHPMFIRAEGVTEVVLQDDGKFKVFGSWTTSLSQGAFSPFREP